MNPALHVAPPAEDLATNALYEPEGERIRRELIEFLERNKIVSMLIDTDRLQVAIGSAKLPPRIKNVLSRWGSIYVVDDVPLSPLRCLYCSVERQTAREFEGFDCVRREGHSFCVNSVRPEAWDDNLKLFMRRLDVRYAVVDTDNFAGDYPDEKFVGPSLPTKELAETIANAFNVKVGLDKYAARYYKVVQMLRPGFEP